MLLNLYKLFSLFSQAIIAVVEQVSLEQAGLSIKNSGDVLYGSDAFVYFSIIDNTKVNRKNLQPNSNKCRFYGLKFPNIFLKHLTTKGFSAFST